jgi:prolyl-tRNA synthetase
MVGAIIMAHGDDTGLRFPPEVAPIQVSFVCDAGAALSL